MRGGKAGAGGAVAASTGIALALHTAAIARHSRKWHREQHRRAALHRLSRVAEAFQDLESRKEGLFKAALVMQE